MNRPVKFITMVISELGMCGVFFLPVCVFVAFVWPLILGASILTTFFTVDGPAIMCVIKSWALGVVTMTVVTLSGIFVYYVYKCIVDMWNLWKSSK